MESAPRGYRTAKRSLLLRAASFFYRMVWKRLSLKDVAKNNDVEYRLMTSSDDAGLENWVKRLNPDVIVVHSMSQLLKEKIFSIPRYGAINLHPSMLPSYRGPNPDFWQYVDMELNPGATVHYIDEGEDTGDIIFQERVPISVGTKSPERLDKLIGQLGVTLLLRSLDAIAIGRAPRIKQAKESPTPRARSLKPEEHSAIIKWKDWSGKRVWHVLRGTELWLNALPQPSGIYVGQRWVVEEYERDAEIEGVPGRIGKVAGRYYVETKDGRVYLRREFSVKKFLIWLLKRDK